MDIVRLADCTLVLLVPGMGDDVQNMKAGLMEIADIFVLNKSDRDGVERLEAELEAMLHLAPERNGWKPVIVRTVATENKGVDELAQAIAKYRESIREQRRAAGTENRTLEIEATRARGRSFSQTRRTAAWMAKPRSTRLAREVANRRKDPYAAVRELLARADGARSRA